MSAVFSPCRSWRYVLERRLDDAPLFARGIAVFIGLNPSTADEVIDDPTIRRCKAFARDWGFGTYRMLNLYAWRSTDPRALAKVPDPIGPENDAHLIDGTSDADVVICAWGTNALGNRAEDVVAMLRGKNAGGVMRRLHCLRLTKNGAPSHPLYLPGDLKPIPFTQRTVSP
jgi:hypothetical protein